ncbi:hypothetical protein G7076_02895 [Sphingomonas sp. HDW15A]|uniref:MvaI/BcnI family restriction endonuclease n=1 Tax=Sphingomonas sp. HDW15A TaxID=2714942 RepID=UPI0014099197|nr:MvaI/BcnI family restriction endonuclease [Sphingomonas sp. HDW15A]QIK95564.1 hypothetical protein G7076_02895 [Sphingomonas sp. HDW15A]
MLSSSNRDVAATLRVFADHGIDCAFIVPTATGLEKSIMDATYGVRAWLREQGIHDYAGQLQGRDSKVLIDTVLFSSGEVIETSTSLYRPNAKEGDPRIWFGSLAKFAGPGDLLAICAAGKKLLVVNTSRSDLPSLLDNRASPFWRAWSSERPTPEILARMSAAEATEILLGYTSCPSSQAAPSPLLAMAEEQPGRSTQPGTLSQEALELLSMLKSVGSRGFVPTLRPGDTGVGFTLESLLGIRCNSSKAPDYKGIEIKAGRKGSHERGRTTILSQVPDWSISRLKGSADILRERGRFSEKKGRNQLFHEMCASTCNSYGLLLEVDGNDFLHQSWTDGTSVVRDATWKFEKLFARLAEKHGQTFWVKAETQGTGAAEKFHYVAARYTSGVSEARLPMLLEAGVITLDYTIKETKTGTAKDQGYLFKIRQSDLPLLFKSPLDFDLAA